MASVLMNHPGSKQGVEGIGILRIGSLFEPQHWISVCSFVAMVRDDPMSGRVKIEDARYWAMSTLPIVDAVRNEGASTLQEIADALNARGVKALRGGDWTSMQVWRLLRQATNGSLPEGR